MVAKHDHEFIVLWKVQQVQKRVITKACKRCKTAMATRECRTAPCIPWQERAQYKKNGLDPWPKMDLWKRWCSRALGNEQALVEGFETDEAEAKKRGASIVPCLDK